MEITHLLLCEIGSCNYGGRDAPQCRLQAADPGELKKLQSASKGLRGRQAAAVAPGPGRGDTMAQLNRQAGSRGAGSSCLRSFVLSGPQQIGLRPPALRRAVCLPSPLTQMLVMSRNALTATPRNSVYFWGPHGPIKLTQKIYHRTKYLRRG